MKRFIITEKTLKTEPLFIGNCTYQEMWDYLVKRFNVSRGQYPVAEDGDNTTASVLHFNGEPYRVVWFKEMKLDTDSLGEVAHELFHLVIRICEDKGIPIIANLEDGRVADEPPAYMIDFFMREYISRIKRKPRKKVVPKPDRKKD